MLRSFGHKSTGIVFEFQHEQYIQRRGRRPWARVTASSMGEDRLQVVFVSTEVAPWSKVGGLADVVAALPAALAARGHSVMTVAPRYEPYQDTASTGIRVPLRLPSSHTSSESVACGFPQMRVPCGSPPSRRQDGRGRQTERKDEMSFEGSEVDVALATIEHGHYALPESGKNSNLDEAELFIAAHSQHNNRVTRVFADHAMLRATDIYSFGQIKSALTYLEGDSGDSNLHIRYSILCQAALAAAALLQEEDIFSSESPTSSLLGDGTHSPSPRIVFVANDWPTALILLQLQYEFWRRPHQVAKAVHQIRTSSSSFHEEDDSEARPRRVFDDSFVADRLAYSSTAMCIHNLAYQGIFPSESFRDLCLPRAALDALCSSTPWESVLLEISNNNLISGSGGGPGRGRNHGEEEEEVEIPCQCCGGGAVSKNEIPCPHSPHAKVECDCDGGLNFMRAALITCDEVVTVSPSYADEIVSDAEMACGMQEILAARGITGIMNGIDVGEWNPEADRFLPLDGRYTSATFSEGKARMKILLQRRLGLDEDPNAALFVFIGRLTEQKGVDVLLGALPMVLAGPSIPSPRRSSDIGDPIERSKPTGIHNKGKHLPGIVDKTDGVNCKIQIAMLGTGDTWMEAALGGLERSFPGQAVGVTKFSEELAHWLLAAADYVLVPSRFEPCGLIAQCGARYGAVPIVTAVGGLKDLVVPDVVGHALTPLSRSGDPSGRRADVFRLAESIHCAGQDCGGVKHRDMQRTCMALDLSWDRPAGEWELLLRRASTHATRRYLPRR